MNKLLLIGNYTFTGESKGIYTIRMDMETGSLAIVDVCTDCENPSFLAQQGDAVFAVHELMDRGCIASYRVDAQGKLEHKHRQDMPGGLMCHLNLWPGGRYLTATNYWTGSMLVCPISDDGIVGAPISINQYSGKSINPQRQEGPHTHSTAIDPSEKWLVCAELGIDQIFIYEFDKESGALLNTAPVSSVKAPAGAGPRHFTFHPDGTKLYVSAELSNEVLVYDFEPQTGNLSWMQKLSTLPVNFTQENLAADIHCDSNGKYLYVSNRGHESIAVFCIQHDGTLVSAGHRSCLGSGPRSFTLLDGWMLIANQGSGSVSVCKVDENGMPGEKVAEVSIPQASHILPLK